MSDQEHLMDLLRKEVRSLLMAVKEGLTPVQLEQEYLTMIGKPLPLRTLGYRSTMELVKDMPDVVNICSCRDGCVVLKVIADETTRGLASLVAKQRTSSKAQNIMRRTNAFSRPRLPRRGRTAPILPAMVKSELKDLLSLSPVLLSDFDKAFARRFGRTFQYTRYGFFSMIEVLSAASDIIAIEQTRAGSLLTLKESPSVKQQQEKLSQGEAVYVFNLGQLEKDIKMMFAQKGAGGTVSSELKEKIRVVSVADIWKSGVLNVMEFVGALNDILYVERKEGEQDWLVFDLESKCLQSKDEICQSDSLTFSLGAAELKVSTFNHLSEHQILFLLFLALQYWDVEELQLAREIAEPEIPPDAVQDRSLYCLPALDSSSLVGVFVEKIISPNQFYIRICSKETSEMLEDMMIEMRRCYSNKNVSDRYVMTEGLVQPGHLCCVRISEDKWWYRVIIHRVLSEQEVEVFFPDFGNLRTVQKSCLRLLKCCYSKLPAQAIPCSLAWVKPIEGHWTTNAILQFWKLCNLKPLVGVVDEYVNGILHLFLCDTTADEDTYIHQVLRAEGHAVICRENIPSKGFIEQNPSELYLQPSPNDGSSGSDLPLQEQESFCEIISCFFLKESLHLDIPYLEPVSVISDIWDENWLPLQTLQKQMGIGHDTLQLDTVISSSQTSSHEGRNQSLQSEEQLQQVTSNLSWREGNGQMPHASLGDLSDPAVLSKSLEEFYVSLSCSQPSAEPSQLETDQNKISLNKVQLLTAPAASASLTTAPVSLEKQNGEVMPETVKNEDLLRTQVITLSSSNNCSNRRAEDQNSLILAAELQVSQKLYVPRSSPTAALGAAARLATSNGLFHSFAVLRKLET
uniref:Tudor domain-containing protein 5 n=1 Tax=Gopherus evgoodei TaxID=1825980 RepID=A0A8C4WHT7_9SAUR